jgi:hypothetical protein
MRYLLSGLILLSLGHTLRAADQSVGKVEVHLKSGETILGVLVGEDTDSVTVRRTMRSRSGSATADVHYQRSDLDDLMDLNQAYSEKASHVGSTVPAQLALAHWCTERELTDQAATHAIAAATIDRSNEDAHTLLTSLGYIQISGKWLKEDDYLESHGLARYLDKIYHLTDKQNIVTAHTSQLAAELDLADKQKALDRLQTFTALDQKSIEADKKKSEDLDADIKDKTTKLAAAQKQTEDDQKKLDAANKAVSAASGRRSMGPSETIITAQKTAQQTVADDKSKASDLQTDIDKDKQAKAEIVSRDQHLTEEIASLTKQVSTATSDVSAATATVDKARKNTDDVIAHATPVPLPTG